jgi:hypothetical protein
MEYLATRVGGDCDSKATALKQELFEWITLCMLETWLVELVLL